MIYARPKDLDAALSLLSDGRSQVIAGGTDIYPAMGQGPQPAALLDVTDVAGFNQISRGDTGVRFGAGVTWSDVIATDLPPAFDALKVAARDVGSVQIQNAGTLAGNLCNASPAADGVPALLALDASVTLASEARGPRTIALSDFLLGPRQTALAADELLTEIIVPKPPEGMTSAFAKLGARRYLVISIAMTAVNVALDSAGRIEDLRIAVGACGPVATRLTALEAALHGAYPEKANILPDHLAPLRPIDDVRGTADYRLNAVATQILRTLRQAVAA